MIEAEFTMPFRRRKIQTTELVTYFKISEATTDEYKKRLEARLRENPSANLTDLNKNMKNVADAVMKRTFRKTIDCRGKLSSPLWFTNSIRQEIGKRPKKQEKLLKIVIC